MLETVRASSWVCLMAAKRAFFNMVLGSVGGLVLGLFRWQTCSLGVSIFVGVSGAKWSILAAAVMGLCRGVWVTVR